MERAENGVRGNFPFFHERSFPLGFLTDSKHDPASSLAFPFFFLLARQQQQQQFILSRSTSIHNWILQSNRISRFNEDAHDNLNEFQIEMSTFHLKLNVYLINLIWWFWQVGYRGAIVASSIDRFRRIHRDRWQRHIIRTTTESVPDRSACHSSSCNCSNDDRQFVGVLPAVPNWWPSALGRRFSRFTPGRLWHFT